MTSNPAPSSALRDDRRAGPAREAGGADLRLFVAIYPPEGGLDGQPGARDWLSVLRTLEPPLAHHRATPVQQVHLTLYFIGATPAAELDAVIESVERSTDGIAPFDLTPLRLMSLPNRSPRLVALETDAPPGLLELQRRLAERLARTTRTRPGDRYLPHFTLCRFKQGARPRRVDLRLDYHPFTVHRVVLVQSVLRREGAEHRSLREVELR